MSMNESGAEENKPTWEHLDTAAGSLTHYASPPLLPKHWSEPFLLPFGLPAIPQMPDRPRDIFRWLWGNPWTPALLGAASAMLLILGYPLVFFMAMGMATEPNGWVSMFFAGAVVLAIVGAVTSAVVAVLWLGYLIVRRRWYALVMLPPLVLPLLPLLPVIVWVMFAEPTSE